METGESRCTSRDLPKGANDAAGIPCGQHVRGNGAGHHAAGADDAAGADGDSRADDGAPAYTHIGLDAHRLGIFAPLPAFLRTERMHRCTDLNGGSDEDVVTNGDGHHIENHAVEIEEHLGTKNNVGAVVAEEGRLHPHIAGIAQQLLEDEAPLTLLALTRGIEALAEITAALAFAGEFRIASADCN